jgi:histidinol-phosphatase (PHP family)
MAQSKLFDFLAHPDLVKKFGYKPEGDLKRFYLKALDTIADCGQAIEINTAGLRKDCKEQYPSRTFLEEAHRRDIPILINSDAHAPQEVGHAFDQAIQLAWDIGYRQLLRFEKRQRISTKIDKL